LLLALDGVTAGKSHRDIAVDLFGAEAVQAQWDAGSWVRSRVRRRIRKALDLMNGGYRELLETDK